MGPRERRSTVLTPVEEAMIVAFRQRTMLPLDDVVGCLRGSSPKLTRSSLHRCLERHGISRLPATGVKTARGRFAETTIDYVHIDSCELDTFCHWAFGSSAIVISREGHASVRDRRCGRHMMRLA